MEERAALLLSLPDLDMAVRVDGLDAARLRARYGYLDACIGPAGAVTDRPSVCRVGLSPSLARALHCLDGDEEILCAGKGGWREVWFGDGCHAYSVEHAAAVVRQAHRAPGLAFNAALTRALALQGGMVVHAMAFAYQGVGYLALGDSGAGKSTLAVAVLLAGGRVVSDDMLLLASPAGQPTAAPFRAEIVVRDTVYRHFGERLAAGSIPVAERIVCGERKWSIERARIADRCLSRMRVDRILLLDVADRERASAWRDASNARAYAALVAQSYFFRHRHPLEQAALTEVLRSLGRSARVARVRFGTDLLNDPVRALDGLFRGSA